MPDYSFFDSIKQAEIEYNIGGGDRFRFQDGDNKFRLVSEALTYRSTYKGSVTFKWLCYVLDRKDNRVKLMFLPHSIMKAIGDFQQDADYTFTGYPMPYDINVKAKNAGKKEVEYSVIPAKKATELTEAEMTDITNQKPLEQIKEKLRAKEKDEDVKPLEATDVSTEPDPADVEQIPF